MENPITKNNIHDKIIELKKSIETSFIKMGAFLKVIKDDKLFREKGCETFEEYLAIPELSLNRSTVYAIINVFEVFFEKSNQSDKLELINDFDLAEIGYSKLSRISQFKDDPDFDEWIAKAKTLSLSDLGAEIRETKGMPEKTETRTKERTISEITCPKCGYEFDYIIKERG